MSCPACPPHKDTILYIVFNVILPVTDVVSDLLGGISLVESGHPEWGYAVIGFAVGPTLLLMSAIMAYLCGSCCFGKSDGVGETVATMVVAVLAFLPGMLFIL